MFNATHMIISFTFIVTTMKYLRNLVFNANDGDEASFTSKVNKHHFCLKYSHKVYC